jgi:hypothetical protein
MVAEKLGLALEILRSPLITVDCFGGPSARRAWRAFTAPHPKLPLVGRKTFGVALQRIAPRDKLFAGGRFKTFRYNVRQAEKAGYRFSRIDPAERVEEIMAINRSALFRQGKRMHDSYTDPDRVRRASGDRGQWFGVEDRDGVLRAYCYAPVIGQVFVFSRILGDAQFLEHSIMYLLVRDTIREMAARREMSGSPDYAMYDMFLGANPGLIEFKRRSGFDPVRVRWRWVEK